MGAKVQKNIYIENIPPFTFLPLFTLLPLLTLLPFYLFTFLPFIVTLSQH